MQGDDQQQGAMFSYRSPEKRVSQDYPLRLIRAISDPVLKELSPEFERLYAANGRPSIAPKTPASKRSRFLLNTAGTHTASAKLYAYTVGNSGKVKRMRNNPRVRIAPCDIRGNVTGPWLEARAKILNGSEALYGDQLLNQKYFPRKQLLNFFASFRRRGRTGFVIRPV